MEFKRKKNLSEVNCFQKFRMNVNQYLLLFKTNNLLNSKASQPINKYQYSPLITNHIKTDLPPHP